MHAEKTGDSENDSKAPGAPMHTHWSEQLAEQVIREKKEPYIVSCGMTTSGPAHFGTVCEFLFPFAIGQELQRKGKRARFYLVADILDALDNVPLPMQKHAKNLEPHFGKPLCDVPDPTGTSRSFGDHYLDEVRELMRKLNVDCHILRANDMYAEGRFDEWARFYLKNEEEAKRLIEESSGRKLPKDFSVIMPICAQCGRIATTRITKHDTEGYEYVCDRDVKYTKGCGFTGNNRLSDHRYKIVWRLHWPAWKQILGTSIEGAGVDHNTRGGSEDTCKAITVQLMKKEYHIPYRYGFILLEGKKYSKSKGLGLGVSELLTLIPPEILKYLLLRPDLEENIDINPTPENLLRAYEEFQQAAGLAGRGTAGGGGKPEELSRADRKKAVAFALSTGRMHWTAPFLDALLYFQIYHDWKRVAEVLGDVNGIQYLRPYIEEWVRREFIPEDYRFKYQPKKAEGMARAWVEQLREGMDALAIHNSVFEFSKTQNTDPKTLFAQLYQTMTGKERGPRLGKLVFALGIDKVKKDLL